MWQRLTHCKRTLFRPGGIFGRWEFSLTRLLRKLIHQKEIKALSDLTDSPAVW